jgi:hypothetical protein
MTDRSGKYRGGRQCGLNPSAKCADVVNLDAGDRLELFAQTLAQRAAETKDENFFPLGR